MAAKRVQSPWEFELKFDIICFIFKKANMEG